MVNYTSKQDVINKGIIRKNGKIYKLSVLEIWHSKECLNSQYADEVGQRAIRIADTLATGVFKI